MKNDRQWRKQDEEKEAVYEDVTFRRNYDVFE